MGLPATGGAQHGSTDGAESVTRTSRCAPHRYAALRSRGDLPTALLGRRRRQSSKRGPRRIRLHRSRWKLHWKNWLRSRLLASHLIRQPWQIAT
eukprot:197083-Prymnesium_polylepis.1